MELLVEKCFAQVTFAADIIRISLILPEDWSVLKKFDNRPSSPYFPSKRG